MTKFETAVDACKRQMKQQKIPCKEPLLTSIAKSLGPSLYNNDAKKVAASQKSELATIRKNFLIKKLKCKDGPELDKALDYAVKKIGPSNRNKLRPVFYYLLVTKLKKESKYR